MERIKKKRAVLRIAASAFAVAFIVFAIMLARELWQTKKEADSFAELAAMRLPKEETQPTAGAAATSKPIQINIIVNEDNTASAETVETGAVVEGIDEPLSEEEQPEEPSRLQRYLPLYERNHDFFAWLTVPDTIVDYPVMYSPDRPLQYLGHDFDGNFSYAGVPFLDSDCDPDGSYYLVYGHQMRNGAMFGGLLAYEDKSFWESHPIFYFDTLYEERTYEVIAVIRSRVLDQEERGFRYYNYTSLDSPKEFDEYMRQVRKLAMYDTGIDASYGDELLVLSTCHHYTQNGRFAIIAKRVV